MAKKKTATTVPSETVSVDAPKAPKLNKDGTPRAKPVRLPVLEAFTNKLAKYAKDEEAAVERAAALNTAFSGFETTLKAWGKLTAENPTIGEMQDIAKSLSTEGFVPPKGRVTVETFVEGTPVQIKEDFRAAYSHVYSEIERTTMVYDFYDDVNKRAMCKTDGRTMIVKPKHLEPRAIVAI